VALGEKATGALRYGQLLWKENDVEQIFVFVFGSCKIVLICFLKSM